MSIDSTDKQSTPERDQIQEPSPDTGDSSFLPAHSEQRPILSVVMPTLNEEEGIRECIEWVETAVESLDIPTELIISDSSTDRTPESAREMGAIVLSPDQPGYGYAYRYAFERTRGRYIVMGDADTTYDFKQIPRLLTHLQGEDADMVLGSRLEGEIKSGAMPALHQYIGNPALTTFLNIFYDAGVSDAHSGFRIFTRDAYETMELETTGMEFASEMIMEAGAKDLDIAEVPIVLHEREGEETLDSFQDGWRHVRFMLVNAPGYLFSVPGLLLGMAGLFIMGLVSLSGSIAGVTLGIHSMIAGSLLTIVGYQVGTMGLFAATTSDPIRRPDDPVTNWLLENVSLEQSVTSGLCIFVGAAGYATTLVVEWYSNGFGSVAFTVSSMIAFTAIVISIQTIFSAFFLESVN